MDGEAMNQDALEKRFRIAGLLICFGLVVVLLTLFWQHPTAFLFCLGLGGGGIGLGVVIYLHTIVTHRS